MKKVILAFAFSFFAASAVFAQSEPVQSQPAQNDQAVEATVTDQEEGNKTKIEKEELPEKVQSALQTGYAEAEVKEVYKVEATDGTETTYEVHIDQAGETVKLHYDASGEPVENKG